MKAKESRTFEEPKVEFISIDSTEVIATSSCLDTEYQTAYQMCGCTNSTSAAEAQCPDGWV